MLIEIDDKKIKYVEMVGISGSYNVAIAAYASAVKHALQQIVAEAIKDGYELLLNSVELQFIDYRLDKAKGMHVEESDFFVVVRVEAIKKEDTSHE